MEPELVKEFIAEYHRELNRLNAGAEQQIVRGRGELRKIEREIDRLVQAIKDGVHAIRVKEELETLEARRMVLERELQRTPEPAPRLHPNLAELYRQKVASLRDSLNDTGTRTEAANIIRDLVEEIRLHPDKDVLKIELVGDLARILSLANENPRRNGPAGVQLTLVAGARYRTYLTPPLRISLRPAA